jgi:hypothetical protein
MNWPNPRKAFADAYVRHVQKKAAQHADKVRELQAEASRTDEQTIRFDVFDQDVRQRGLIEQQVYSYVVRVEKTGHLVVLPPATPHDVRVMTDVPTLWGFANSRMDLTLTDGGRKRIEPFTPRDAVRLGLLETDGSGSALRNLFLLERSVLPRLAGDLKLPSPPDR